MNALSVVTKLIDMQYDTKYCERFLNYLKHFQKNDTVANCAQTDVKGDRIRRPHEQEDPDLYLRVVEKRDDGIIVRGAKAHNTIAPYADEIIAIPTRTLTKEEGDWAVAFAIPADADGVKLVVRPAYLRKRIKLHAPIAKFGDAESLTIFDDVFVPWERVFMCGEWEHGRTLALLFALYHRHSYTGCKPAVTDVLGGTAALIAECNNIERATHVRDKLSHFIGLSELVYAAGIASAHHAKESPSGTYIPDPVYTNAGRRLAGENIYPEYELLADLAGGLAATLPFEADFYNEETGDLLNKYIMRNPKLSSEYVHRAFRLVENILASDLTGVLQVAGVHGGGSPVMETIMMVGTYNIEKIKDIARYLAGIKKELPRTRREDLVKFL
jgi:4-hydroxybutyryl-CoA dehydratase/vinylacetyl-CoA-Delta-isomerase